MHFSVLLRRGGGGIVIFVTTVVSTFTVQEHICFKCTFVLSTFQSNNTQEMLIMFFLHLCMTKWRYNTAAWVFLLNRYIFPKFTLAWTEFLGLRVQIPDPSLPYIEANYGKKWEVPVHDWDWKKSPANVHTNGQWLENEREEVIQLFEWEKDTGGWSYTSIMTVVSNG